MTQFVRSSRQASQIFGLTGSHAPRPKNLFYVKFNLGTDTSVGATAPPWSGELSFLIKSTERPQVQPQVEELKQYGKVRQIHTGVKYSPLRMVFYETMDNLAVQMFADYSRNFFGAFGHDSVRDDYLYDITIQTAIAGGTTANIPFKDGAGTGWGFNPLAAASTNTDANSHFYFRSISVFEVWGNQYVQYDIINPKITAFDPEGLSYEDSQIGTISMSVAYEAVIYVNGGAPKSFDATNASDSSGLSAAFTGSFAGNTIDYPNDTTTLPTNTYTDYVYAATPTPTSPYLLTSVYSTPYQSVETDPYLITTDLTTGGALATYGDYSFGQSQASPSVNAQADLLGAVASNSSLATALSIITSPTSQGQSGAVTTALQTPSAFSSDQVEAALAATAALGAKKTPIDTTFYTQTLAAGAMSAAASQGTMPREQIFTQNPAVVSTASWDSSTPLSAGIALSPAAYSAINANRPATAQVGFNTRTFRSQSG